MHYRTLTALLVALPVALAAQSERERGYLFREPPFTVTLSGGLGLPVTGGDLWAFTFDELTMSRGDLASFDQGADLAIRLHERFDLVIGYALSDSRVRTEMRDWVEDNDQPITQRTRFIRRPLGATLRYHLRPRGRMIGNYAWVPNPFAPYVGLGAGRMAYQFQQSGDFVDSETAEIFEDRYVARGTVGFVTASGGVIWSLFPSLALTGEMRYLHASADGRPSFQGFEKLDLSGVSTLLGLTIRFN